MTVDDVQAMLDKIRSISDDSERAHAEEDAMFLAILSDIAAGTCSDPKACANLALQSRNIDFVRYYA